MVVVAAIVASVSLISIPIVERRVPTSPAPNLAKVVRRAHIRRTSCRRCCRSDRFVAISHHPDLLEVDDIQGELAEVEDVLVAVDREE